MESSKQLQLDSIGFEKGFLPGLSISQFKENEFRKAWLHLSSGVADYFAPLFPPGQLSQILSSQLLVKPAIRMIGENRVLPFFEISAEIPYSKFVFENVVDVTKVRKWFSAGYTLNLRGVHLFDQRLARATGILSEIFGCYVRANIYVTPEGMTGLVPHYDVHDVFVVQISGSKKWSIYRRAFDNPTSRHEFKPQEHDVGPEEHQVVLSPGDVLYLPRGMPHSATTLNEGGASVHITFGIEEPVLTDLLRVLADHFEDEPYFRQSLAPDLENAAGAYLEGVFKSISARIETMSDSDRRNLAALVRALSKGRCPDRDTEFLNGL